MPYDYINDTYDKNIKSGMRVEFTEDGRLGTVQKAKGAGGGNYIRVKFDGNTNVSNCHPNSITTD